MTPTAESPLRLHRAPEGFAPLRLVLQPSGLVLEVNDPDVVVGRHSEAGLRLPLPDVSRRHCRLQFQDGGWQVTDLNSLNGVQVNGDTVLRAPLDSGDTLRVGGFTFAVHVGNSGHVHSIVQTLTRKAS